MVCGANLCSWFCPGNTSPRPAFSENTKACHSPGGCSYLFIIGKLIVSWHFFFLLGCFLNAYCLFYSGLYLVPQDYSFMSQFYRLKLNTGVRDPLSLEE